MLVFGPKYISPEKESHGKSVFVAVAGHESRQASFHMYSASRDAGTVNDRTRSGQELPRIRATEARLRTLPSLMDRGLALEKGHPPGP